MLATEVVAKLAPEGSAQALTDLPGGHTALLIDPVTVSTLAHVRSGKIKLIGTLGARPADLTPQAPVFAAVAPGFDCSGVFGLVARAGTPPALVRHIRADLVAVMRLPEVSERTRSIGQEAVASTPEDYNAYIGQAHPDVFSGRVDRTASGRLVASTRGDHR